MTDLRQLAERIAHQHGIQFWPSDPRPEYEHESLADMVERILREHHEELRRNLGSVLYQAQMLGYALPGEGFVEAYDNLVLSLGAIVDALGEGGEQDAMPQDRASNQGPADMARAAAPDQPHEFDPIHPVSFAKDRRCWHIYQDVPCGRPADHPIHQTNEVNDEASGADRSDNDRNNVPDGDAIGRSGQVRGLADDRTLVTNYDAEAEARAQEGAYVRPGDEVREVETEIVYKVVGLTFKRDDCVWCEDSDGSISWFWFSELRTLDGRPVAGFRERPCECCDAMAKACEELEDDKEYNANLCREKDLRIAELERELGEWKQGSAAEAKRSDEEYELRMKAESERDEARAERDDMHKLLIQFKAPAYWVRLDDETIERVRHTTVERWRNGNNTWPTTLDHTLRDLRDGKLKEGE